MQTIKDNFINRHGLRIVTQVDIPATSRGLMFLVHGWKSSMNGATMQPVAEAAHANNLTTVRFDCTHSAGESDGEIPRSTITTFVKDLEDVVSWARGQGWFQAPYSVAGGSLGGITVLEHAHKYADEVKALIPIVTVVSGALSRDALEARSPGAYSAWQRDGHMVVDSSKGDQSIPWSHAEDRLKYNAMTYADQLTMPVFMCGAEHDTSCPVPHQNLLFNALGSKNKEMHVIPGCPHRITEPQHAEFLRTRLSRFLRGIYPP